MGKSRKVTVGYWYHPAFHMGISLGPIDALLEIRGGDVTAWSGNVVASGTIPVNAPNLWGGEKDQGGIAGDFELMMGGPAQQPNAYLTQTFGDKQPAWRGLTTIVFKGGRYGAMNPYPQKISYKGMKITHGWDGDPGDGSACWYPEKAAVGILGEGSLSAGLFSVKGSDTVGAQSAEFGIYGADYLGDADTIARQCLAVRNASDAGHFTFSQSYVYWNGVGYDVSCTSIEEGESVGIAAVHVVPVCPLGTVFASFTEHGTPSSLGTTEPTVNCGIPTSATMNPAHTLYYARTQQHMGREPVANMDDASHRAGADWFYSQGFGICWDYDPSQESVDQFIARIEKVSGCSQTRSPVDGKWYLDVANGQYDLASLPILTDDDILDFQRQPTTLDSAVNSVSVQYFDPQQKADVTTPSVEALALVNAFGTIHQDVTYKEIPTSDLAMRVAQRDLLHTVTPTNGFQLTTTRKTYAWRRGTYFRLQVPKRGIADMVCILGDIDTGTLKSGAIKITATQDVYSLPTASFVQQEPGVDTRPSQIPAAIVNQAAFEAPYIELVRSLSRADLSALPSEVGYLMTVAQDPATSRDYTITVSTDGGATYAGNNTGVWGPTALIVEGDALQDAAPATAFTITDGSLLSSVQIGSAALWDGEIVRVDAIDAVVGTLTLGRGCADTPPIPHAANARIWFFDGFAGADTTEYATGETVDVKLLTNTSTQQLNPLLATPLALTFAGRQARPYPPAGLLINSSPYPSTVVDGAALTWVPRNRDTQADQLIATSQAGIAAPSGATYTVRTFTDGTLVDTSSGIAALGLSLMPPDGQIRVEVTTVVGGQESYQPLVATFAFSSMITITTTSPITFVVGAAATQQLTADGGTAPLAWTATGLPTGMTLSSAGELAYDGATAIAATNVEFTVTDAQSRTKSATLVVSAQALHRYWRLYVTANEASGTSSGYMNLSLIALQTQSGAPNQCPGSGGTTTQSSVYSGQYTASNAFNNSKLDGTSDQSSFWHSASQAPPWWAAYDFGAANPKHVGYVTICSTNVGTRAPKDFSIQYSDDGTTWVDVKSCTGVTGWVSETPRGFDLS